MKTIMKISNWITPVTVIIALILFMGIVLVIANIKDSKINEDCINAGYEEAIHSDRGGWFCFDEKTGLAVQHKIISEPQTGVE